MATYQTVVPAYGRDYRSRKDALAAWVVGKDFRCEPQGCYITKAEADARDLAVNIRYNKLQSVIALRPASERRR